MRGFNCELFISLRRKIKAILAAATSIYICSALVGCGDSLPKNQQELESGLNSISEEDFENGNETEKPAESIDADESISEAATEEPIEETAYTPSDEIVNADFSSGLIQIGNDVFRNGGYYTVDQFIAEYGDRYDTSEIVPDGFIQPNTSKSFSIASLDNPEIKVCVYYDSRNIETDENKIRIGDTIVTYVSASGQYASDNCWYPTGIKESAEGYEYSDIPAFLEKIGFVSVTQDQINNEYFKNYGMYWEEFTNRLVATDSGYGDIIFRERGSEQNIAGFYPIFEYDFSFNPETLKIYTFKNNTYALGKIMIGDLDEYTHIE